MKKISPAIAAITMLITCGCNKNSDAPILNSLTGTWQYIGYSGGYHGIPFKPQLLENYIQFDTVTNAFLYKSGDTLQNCTTYSLKNYGDGYGQGYIGTFALQKEILDNGGWGGTGEYDVYMHHDTAVLYLHGCGDCYNIYYEATSKHFNWCADDGTSH